MSLTRSGSLIWPDGPRLKLGEDLGDRDARSRLDLSSTLRPVVAIRSLKLGLEDVRKLDRASRRSSSCPPRPGPWLPAGLRCNRCRRRWSRCSLPERPCPGLRRRWPRGRSVPTFARPSLRRSTRFRPCQATCSSTCWAPASPSRRAAPCSRVGRFCGSGRRGRACPSRVHSARSSRSAHRNTVTLTRSVGSSCLTAKMAASRACSIFRARAHRARPIQDNAQVDRRPQDVDLGQRRRNPYQDIQSRGGVATNGGTRRDDLDAWWLHGLSLPGLRLQSFSRRQAHTQTRSARKDPRTRDTELISVSYACPQAGRRCGPVNRVGRGRSRARRPRPTSCRGRSGRWPRRSGPRGGRRRRSGSWACRCSRRR